MTIRGSMRYLSEERRERGGRSFEYLNSDVIHWGTGPKVASIRKKLKPEIVIDFIKTIATSQPCTQSILYHILLLDPLNYVYKKIIQ